MNDITSELIEIRRMLGGISGNINDGGDLLYTLTLIADALGTLEGMLLDSMGDTDSLKSDVADLERRVML